MPSNKDKRVCEECHGRFWKDELLTAFSPFNHEDILTGCPKCRAVNSIRTTCDEDDCWEQDTCGTPVGEGDYRRTCWKHRPDKE